MGGDVMKINTSLGTLVVERATDLEHPGVWVSLILRDGHYVSLSGVEIDQDDAGNDFLQTVVWEEDDGYDPTDIIRHKVPVDKGKNV